MIVDTSAVIALLHGEPGSVELAEMLVAHDVRMSAANWVEGAMVAARGGQPRGTERYDAIVREAGIVIEPVTLVHARAARAAFLRYGRGSGSPARLNFGDCFAYALAATSGEPLLFKGDDFTHTDVLRALA